ncbi:glycosyl transferase [Vibrio zhanjiangensis]|uniref:Glycosyl transferase n=1 Tax=Vibrio zhanjiangensis TaxID=1046128 RepID=A0ABQ6EX36_9VIBR|nr:glycosyltransferase family 2 protein [Vibrio zhanjiangensis]GLT17529.1 glycosyl transferase [Vibrio zhanjiangensis]
MVKYSLVLPIYKNEKNIAPLLLALENLQQRLSGQCEFIFVIDGSPDDSEQVILDQATKNIDHSVLLSLSKNYGSFTAIRAGMGEAKGKFIAVMAADLQEPPELILELFSTLETGKTDICFGQRVSRKDPYGKKLLSKLFWGAYRRLVISEIPSGGVDIFACNVKVRDSVLSIEERNSSLVAQLFWVGYRRAFVPYERREREIGKSAWGFRKRVRYMLDSIFSYTDLPIMLLLVIGTIGLLLSLMYIFFISLAYMFGLIEQPGFTSQSILITLFGSASILGQGILGCYLWRILENSKKRPLYIIDKKIELTKN